MRSGFLSVLESIPCSKPKFLRRTRSIPGKQANSTALCPSHRPTAKHHTKKIFENPLALLAAHDHDLRPAHTKPSQILSFSLRILRAHQPLPSPGHQLSTHLKHHVTQPTSTPGHRKTPNQTPSHNAPTLNAPLQQAFSAPQFTPPTPLNAGREPPSAARAEFIQSPEKRRKFAFSPPPRRIDPRCPPELSSPVIAVEPRRQRGRTRGGRRLRSHGIPEGGSSIA
jgi:hypothetical protein